MKPASHSHGASHLRGLTLLELVLVVLILSTLALLTASTVDSADEQLRFEDTRTRLELVRRGVVGRPEASAGGQPVVSGFAVDVGRLPRSLEELLEPVGLPEWSFDELAGQWGGWRGPYVAGLLERDGLLSFRDGWGRPVDPLAPELHGWMRFEARPGLGTLEMQSYGSDGRAGGDGYAADYPPAGAELIVSATDHLVNVKSLAVTVLFHNGGPAAVTPGSVRLRLLYPEDGSFEWPSSWPATPAARDAVAWLSESQRVGELGPGESLPVELSFLTPAGGPFVDKPVPWGLRSLVVVEDDTGARVGGTARAHPLTLLPRAAVADVDDMVWELGF